MHSHFRARGGPTRSLPANKAPILPPPTGQNPPATTVNSRERNQMDGVGVVKLSAATRITVTGPQP